MDDAYIIASSGLFVVMLDFIARRASPKFGEAMRRTFKPLVDVTVKNTASEPYWTNRLGPIRGLIAQWFVDMDLLRESEFMINYGTNEQVLEWKKSCLASSSTCAMAVCVSLPGFSTHLLEAQLQVTRRPSTWM